MILLWFYYNYYTQNLEFKFLEEIPKHESVLHDTNFLLAKTFKIISMQLGHMVLNFMVLQKGLIHYLMIFYF